ncbi:hypothetical protein [Streptomyces mirabilis]|uniref:hypothetical protein n=1 Tax=Streptomyces mirabilis TaxID=68239 RepID=UPI00368FD9B1
MGESAKRRARRQKEHAAARSSAAAPRGTLAAPSAPFTAAEPEPEEINFMLTPGGLLRPEGAPPLSEKPKTVRVPGPMNEHVVYFQARHGSKRFSFVKVCLALWRVLLREEHEALEAARREAAATGVPAQPVMGPIYRALRDELELMRREDTGEIFDDE